MAAHRRVLIQAGGTVGGPVPGFPELGQEIAPDGVDEAGGLRIGRHRRSRSIRSPSATVKGSGRNRRSVTLSRTSMKPVISWLSLLEVGACR